MDEKSYVELAVLNVTASPHPEGAYRHFFESIAQRHVNFWGDSFATLSRPETIESGFFRGRLVVWTEIDKSQPAVNTEKLQQVRWTDLGLDIPENIGFNGRIFTYVFRERDHILFVESTNEFSKKLSPRRIQKILRILADE